MIFLVVKIISLALFALYWILMTDFLYGWYKIKIFRKSEITGNTFVSIVIAARNEEKNIKNIVSDITSQDYDFKKFEVIIVDDNSEDQTKEIISEFLSKPSNLKIIDLSLNGQKGKKQALVEGIKNSMGTLIVTIDADCRLKSSWLSTIVSFYETRNPKIIISPVLINNGKSFLSKFQAVESIGMFGCTAGSTGINRPFICNGANLAFEKDVFLEFNDPLLSSVTSGDDVLFMLKAKKKYKSSILFLKSFDAIVATDSLSFFKDFINQRIRWVSKSKFYKDFDIIFNSFVIFLFCFSILCTLILTLVKLKFLILFFVLLLLKALIDSILFLKVSSFLKNSKLFLYIIPFEFLYVCYVVIFGVLGNFLSFKWKNRIYKH